MSDPPYALRARSYDEVRVLVVDDEPQILKLVAVVLRSAGYQVTLASSGSEALKLIEHNDYELVLSDVRMPELSGPELVMRMRYANAAKIVFMSGAFQSSDNVVLKKGVAAFLKKPFRAGELLQTVRRVTGATAALPHPS